VFHTCHIDCPTAVIDHEDRCTSKQQVEEPATVTPVGNTLNRSDTLTDRTVEKVKSANPKNPYPDVDMLGPTRFRATRKRSGTTVLLGYFTTPEAANEAFVKDWKAARNVAWRLPPGLPLAEKVNDPGLPRGPKRP
jgi:hypothetical protein